MKILTLSALLAVGLAAGCSTTTSNNTNARGANTNTGYMTNSETNARPALNSNVTNVSPGNLTSGNSTGSSSSTGGTNSMSGANSTTGGSNANANRRP